MELVNITAKHRRVRGDHMTACMKLCMQVIALAMVATACNAQAQAPTASPPAIAPAPPPAPMFVNVTQVLAQAGDYSTFVNLMIETKVDQIFQRNANQTQTGITIFAPTNEAFTTKPASTLLKNLTEQQKTSLVEYHALNSWISLGSLQQAQADQNVTSTLATYNNGGGVYQLNLTNDLGVVQILSGWTTANLTSTLYSQQPVSIFAIDEVLLPDDIFGLPSLAPAPSPSSGAPTPSPSSPSSSSASGPSGSKDTSFSPPPFKPSLSFFLTSFLFFKFLTNLHL
eukprot:c18017_g1_i1 orf=311-1162(-)